MKKFTLLLMSLLMVSIFAIAQKKLCVHTIYGEKIEYIASDVAYIDFEDVTTDSEQDPSDNEDDPIKPGDDPVYDGSFVAKPFSISDNKTVTFSPGNLQYYAANDEWRFAPNQTDYIGEDNENISSTYNSWIDLFGWGTGDNPTNKSTDNGDYKTFVDWGINKIGNDAPNTWRTLTYEEWGYIINGRPNSSGLISCAQVNGVYGLILLPDNWTCPSGMQFNCKECYVNGDYQIFSSSEWSKLAASGAVFLPSAGYRESNEVNNLQEYGSYWAATNDGSITNNQLNFSLGIFYMVEGRRGTDRHKGNSVRLVKDYK